MYNITAKKLYNKLRDKINNYSDTELKKLIQKYFFLKHNLSPVELLIDKEIEWNEENEKILLQDISKINQGLPIQYVTQSEFFFDQKFVVNKSVLIPRPETEELVRLIIDEQQSNSKKKILDIGTGSGCIAIILKKKLRSEVTGIDFSAEAIEVAKKNSKKSNHSIDFISVKLENYVPNSRFDIIVSNPPYIPIKDLNSVDINVIDYEPKTALFVNDDPLYFYRAILKFAKKHLVKNGSIYLEINDKYAEDLKNIFSDYKFRIKKDFYDKKRFLIIDKFV